MIKRILLSLLLILQSIMLAGCWDIKEIQDMVYLNAVGVDFEKGKYVIYAQATDFASVAKQESGKPAEPQAWVGRGVGITINDALFDLYQTSQMRMYWGHVTALVLSQAVLKNGIQSVFDLTERYHEVRANIWIYTTNDSMEKIMRALSFFRLSTVYTILHEPKETYHQSSTLPPAYLFRFMSDYTERGKTAHLPSLEMVEDQWSVNGESFPLLGVNGAHIIQRGVYKGWLDLPSLKGYRWLTKEFVRGELTVFKDKKVIAELIIAHPKFKIKPLIKNGKPKFTIEIKAKARVQELIATISENELEKLAQEEITKEIRETYKKGLKFKADVLQLGYTLYRKDSGSWYNMFGRNHHRFPLDEDSIEKIDVKVSIISTGKVKLRNGYDPHKR